MKRAVVLGCLAALFLVALSSEAATAQREARLSKCVVVAIDDVQVPARVAGAIMTLQLENKDPVKEGTKVKKGDLLGKLDDAAAKAENLAKGMQHKVAIAEQAKSAENVTSAVATVEVAEAEVIESEAINKQSPGSIPLVTLRRQRLTQKRAGIEVEVARKDAIAADRTVELRAAEVEISQIAVDRHQIISPLDGEVAELKKHVGEWVNPGDTILRIVYLDKVRVEGLLDVREYLPADVAGRNVRIELRLKDQETPLQFESKISYVSSLVEASIEETTGIFRVWAEVSNRFQQDQFGRQHPVLRPGMTVEMLISLK